MPGRMSCAGGVPNGPGVTKGLKGFRNPKNPIPLNSGLQFGVSYDGIMPGRMPGVGGVTNGPARCAEHAWPRPYAPRSSPRRSSACPHTHEGAY
jgi:hypothetical protein